MFSKKELFLSSSGAGLHFGLCDQWHFSFVFLVLSTALPQLFSDILFLALSASPSSSLNSSLHILHRNMLFFPLLHFLVLLQILQLSANFDAKWPLFWWIFTTKFRSLRTNICRVRSRVLISRAIKKERPGDSPSEEKSWRLWRSGQERENKVVAMTMRNWRTTTNKKYLQKNYGKSSVKKKYFASAVVCENSRRRLTNSHNRQPLPQPQPQSKIFNPRRMNRNLRSFYQRAHFFKASESETQ